MVFRTVFAFLILIVGVGAFAPYKSRSFPANTNTIGKSALHFGFLKELGLEKPSWLPDFGGAKKEAAPEAEPPKEVAESTEESSVEE
jgi:hypothetical protein